eukprot:scaffold63279_cov45-Phaeocystis_antarctica.AAC.2
MLHTPYNATHPYNAAHTYRATPLTVPRPLPCHAPYCAALLTIHPYYTPLHRATPSFTSRSELVAMLLKYGSQKPGTGAYHCPLVQASSELGLSAHDAHAQLQQLQAANYLP